MSKNDNSQKININIGFPWITMWIFTIAFAHLSFGQGMLALVAWPYYLGDAIAAVAGVR